MTLDPFKPTGKVEDEIRLAEFEFVGNQIRDCNLRIEQDFGLFIKLALAVVAGSVWLSLQPGITEAQAHIFWLLSAFSMGGTTLLSMIIIWGRLRSWHGYRKAQTRLGGVDSAGAPRIPPVRRSPLGTEHWAIFIAMVIFALGFAWFNPLRILTAQKADGPSISLQMG